MVLANVPLFRLLVPLFSFCTLVLVFGTVVQFFFGLVPGFWGPGIKITLLQTTLLQPAQISSTVCILAALQRQVDLQGVFVKIGDFIKFKGFLEAILRKFTNPQKIARKVDFSEPRLLQCT